MGLKDAFQKTVDNISDKASELTHDANANAEQATRDAAGDAMTPGEKFGSTVNEGKERVLAGVDKGKQDLRNST